MHCSDMSPLLALAYGPLAPLGYTDIRVGSDRTQGSGWDPGEGRLQSHVE